MRECKFCGRIFQEENGHQIFCSDYCRQEQRNLGKRIKRKEKISQRTYKPRRSHLEWTDEDVQNRINTKSSKIAYIGGYKDSESPMYIMCNDCGNIFKWSARGLRRQSPIQCDYCRHILSEIKQREHNEVVLNNLAIRREQTMLLKSQRESEKIKARYKICKECGKQFFADNLKSIFCSDVCRNKSHNRIHDLNRRLKIKENLIDKDISLIKLYERDEGVCWLCHKKVDWLDFEKREDESFITGENYPSVDHVIALANGGKHSWDNVRLAHFKCNTEKRDKLIGKKENGQMILFC